MEYLLSFIVPILSYLLQVYPRFFNKYFGVDVWTRFLEIDLVRKNNHQIPKKLEDGFILKGNFDYPPLFPMLLSFIPKKKLERWQAYIAPFFDALHCLLIFFIALQITNRIEIALLAQFIYMSIPIVAMENSYLAPRSFGYLHLTLALYPLLLYASSPKFIYLLAGYAFASLLFLAHRFAMQSFLFACIFFSIWDKSIIYLLVYVLSFITAVALSNGYYLHVLKGHWLNIYFWIVNYKNRWVHQVTGKSNSAGKRDLVGKINVLLSKLSPLTLISMNCWLLSAFLFFFLLLNGYHLPVLQNPLLQRFALWILFFYFWGILILSVKRFLAIGEGQRYLEMATAPSAILSSILFFSFLNTPYQILAYAILGCMLVGNFGVILFAQRKVVINDKTRSLTEDILDAFTYINKLKGRPRIICLPHQITTMTIYNSKAEVLVNADNQSLFKDMMLFFPVFTKSVKELAKIFSLDYLLLRESYVSLDELKLSKKDIVFRSGDIVLVNLRK